MVDAEKLNPDEMTDSKNPKETKEGGESKIYPSEATEETENAPKPDLSDDLNQEDQEYSDEEYQRFMDLYDRTLSDIREGQIVIGRVLAVTDQDVLIDIGFKSEGTIPLEEFGEPPEVKVGDKIEVYLETIEDTEGQLILSKKKANFMMLWDKVVDIYNEGSTIEGKCVRRIKGGIVVDLMGVDAFLPGSQIDVKPIRDFDALIGQIFTFKVVKVNRLRKNIVVSRRALLEESMVEQREKVLAELEKGQIREGMVKNITDFGVFVDLGGVDGLLHINDLTWGRINHSSEVVKLDEKIKVVVLDFNDTKDRISLGMKQLQPHPWQGVKEKYPQGTVVKGRVVSITDYGAFVELEKGVEGLIHVSEMSWKRHGIHPSKLVKLGETVEAKILTIDEERKRISLGLKQLTPDPWEDIEKKYPVGSKYKGVVRNMTNFGAFVEIEEGIDGLIHISDLSWTKKIKHPSEVLKKGDEIEIVVLDVNKEERRVSLGYKQLTEDPWPAFEEAYKVDTLTPAKVVRFVDKGLIVELPLGLEGFVPLHQIVESSMAQVTKSIKVGDELNFAVIEFDKENKRVVLSRKKALETEKKEKTEAGKSEVKSSMKKEAEAPALDETTSIETKEKKKEKKAGKTKAKASKKKEEASSQEEGPSKPENEEGGKTSEKKKSEDKKTEEVKAEKTPEEKTEGEGEEEKNSSEEEEEQADESKKDENSAEEEEKV